MDVDALRRVLHAASLQVIPCVVSSGVAVLDAADARMMQDYLLTKIKAFGAAKLLAVQAAVNQGSTENTNAGASTGSYVNLDNVAGSSITWTVN